MTLVFNETAFKHGVTAEDIVMPILTEEEAKALDEELTNTVPEANPNIEGPFIKNYRQSMMVALDQFSARYLASEDAGNKTNSGGIDQQHDSEGNGGCRS
jgi:hypothetical protein